MILFFCQAQPAWKWLVISAVTCQSQSHTEFLLLDMYELTSDLNQPFSTGWKQDLSCTPRLCAPLQQMSRRVLNQWVEPGSQSRTSWSWYPLLFANQPPAFHDHLTKTNVCFHCAHPQRVSCVHWWTRVHYLTKAAETDLWLLLCDWSSRTPCRELLQFMAELSLKSHSRGRLSFSCLYYCECVHVAACWQTCFSVSVLLNSKSKKQWFSLLLQQYWALSLTTSLPPVYVIECWMRAVKAFDP